MKKLSLIASLFFITACAGAQTITYAVNAGVNATTASTTIYGLPPASNNLTGFHVGGVVDLKWDNFSIQPELMYITKGGSILNTSEEVSTGINKTAIGTTNIVLEYIELPVNFLYRIKVRNGSIFLGGGPYAAIGVSAAFKFKGAFSGEAFNTTDELSFGSDPYNQLKRLDIGLNGLIGYQSKLGITISGGYGLSLTNISNNGSPTKNKGYSLSVGYFFE